MPPTAKQRKSLQQLFRANRKAAAPPGPVWEGPDGAGPNGGVTQGLIAKFLSCRERCRLYLVEGLRPADAWNARLGFGSLWHAAEEALAAQRDPAAALHAYAQAQCRKYPLAQEEIESWYQIALAMFPLYVRHWAEHPDVQSRQPLMQEEVFNVPYSLPSGRKVRLRGRWDAVDLCGRGKEAGVFLFETKTKGDIREDLIQRQLTWDLQTMLYLTSLWNRPDDRIQTQRNKGRHGSPIAGVRFNVIRRPQHRQGKKESREDFLSRLAAIIAADPGHFFMRWKVTVTPGDVVKFRRECLDPVLENLTDDGEWWGWCKRHSGDVWDAAARAQQFPHHLPRHFRFPFGVTNITMEGGASDLDEFLESGSTAGLTRTDNLFQELTDA